jgi:hypothetical protein
MTLLRTDWRPLAVSSVKGNETDILEKLILEEKPKKVVVLGLNSVIGVLNFDDHILLKLAMQLVSKAVNPHRLQVTLNLFSYVLHSVKAVAPSLLAEFLGIVEPKIEKLSVQIMSFILLTFAQKVVPTPEFVDFVKKLISLAGRKTTCVARLQQVIVGVSPVSVLKRQVSVATSDTVSPFLRSHRPSIYFAGLRLFEQAALSLPPERANGLKMGIEALANRFVKMAFVPCAADFQYRALMSLLIKTGVPRLHEQLARLTPDAFWSRYIFAGIGFWPAMIRVLPLDSDELKRVYKVVHDLLSEFWSVSVGLRCVKEAIKKAHQKEVLFMDFFKIWMKKLDFAMASKVGEWVVIAEEISLVFGNIVISEVIGNVRPFLFVLSCIGSTLKRRGSESGFHEFLQTAAGGLDDENHKEAIAKLMNGNAKEAWDLAK